MMGQCAGDPWCLLHPAWPWWPYPYPMPCYGEPTAAWICPKCGRVYAPWVRECEFCNRQLVAGTSQTTA